MKKIIGLFILFISFLSFIIITKAESFRKGDYIINEYIDRVKNGAVYYSNAQYFYDSSGNLVYCIEPFETLDTGTDYNEYEGDVTEYKKLSEEVKRRISLIAYYGYGYGDRNTTKWYVVTQVLIWKEIAGDDNVYFTNTLNGTKITKYENEMKQILQDVDNFDEPPSFVKTYEVNINEPFFLGELNQNYEIVNSSYDYTMEEGYSVKKVERDGFVTFKKKSNAYPREIAFFENSHSQDLIRPGNVESYEYDVNIKVIKGNIILHILPDDSVYTVESDFSNTCYEITNENEEVVNFACTSTIEMLYTSSDLPFGKYKVKQYKHGIGYREDPKVYEVELTTNNRRVVVTLENILIRNTIEITKYACKEDLCSFEANANFEVYDKNNDLVKTLTTNELGYTSIVLGYGTYSIKQIKGANDYTLAEPYQEKIVDEETPHKKELFNYYDGEIPEEEPDVVPEEENNVEILPPDTGVSFKYVTPFLLMIAIVIKKMIR